MDFLEPIREETFNMYALRNYRNPQCISEEEFRQDLLKIGYIRRASARFLDNQGQDITKIINSIILVFNVFGIEGAMKLLDFRLDSNHWCVVKPILIYLGYIKTTDLPEVRLNKTVVERLRSMQ